MCRKEESAEDFVEDENKKIISKAGGGSNSGQAPTHSEVQMWNLGLLAREQIRPVLRSALLVALDSACRGGRNEEEIGRIVAKKVREVYSLQRPETSCTGRSMTTFGQDIPEDEDKKRWTLFMSTAIGALVENLRIEARLEEKGGDVGILLEKKRILEEEVFFGFVHVRCGFVSESHGFRRLSLRERRKSNVLQRGSSHHKYRRHGVGMLFGYCYIERGSPALFLQWSNR